MTQPILCNIPSRFYKVGDVWLKTIRKTRFSTKQVQKQIVAMHHDNVIYDCTILRNGLIDHIRRESATTESFRAWASYAEYKGTLSNSCD